MSDTEDYNDEDDLDEQEDQPDSEELPPNASASAIPTADAEEKKAEPENDDDYSLPENDEEPEDVPKTASMVIPLSERVTFPVLTIFERARILGARATQLSAGAPALVDCDAGLDRGDPITIANMEIQKRVLPVIVRRKLPDGRFEEWKLSELLVD